MKVRNWLQSNHTRVGDALFWAVWWGLVMLLMSGALTNNTSTDEPIQVEVSCSTGQLLTWEDKYHGADVCTVTQP